MFGSHEASRKKVIARRPFTPHEDAALIRLVGSDGETDWEAVSRQMEGRTARQCRERWLNYLSPSIRSDPWTDFEDRLLVAQINELGHSWATIGHAFNGRSENDVKNRWYSHLRFRCVFNPMIQALMLLPGECNLMFPDRKKRKRSRVRPQQNAMRLIEEEKAASPPAVPASEKLGAPPPHVIDFVSPFEMEEERHEFPEFLSLNAGFSFGGSFF